MRQSISYFLIFSLVIQLFWGSGYLIDYYVNSDIYKENCQNKDKLELKCDGKCILAQKLMASQSEEEEEAFWSPISFEYLWSANKVALSITFYLRSHKTHFFDSFIPSFSKDIFKPPI